MTERRTTPKPADPRPGEQHRTAGAQPTDPRAARTEKVAQTTENGQQPTALLSGPELEALLRRWHEIQAGFVDAPQQAVQDADTLVADLVNRLTQMLAAERRQLESRWSRGDQVSTEDLRVAFQRYRSFFQQLVSARSAGSVGSVR